MGAAHSLFAYLQDERISSYEGRALEAIEAIEHLRLSLDAEDELQHQMDKNLGEINTGSVSKFSIEMMFEDVEVWRIQRRDRDFPGQTRVLTSGYLKVDQRNPLVLLFQELGCKEWVPIARRMSPTTDVFEIAPAKKKGDPILAFFNSQQSAGKAVILYSSGSSFSRTK